MHDGPDRAHPLPAQPARRAVPADRRHVRARRVDGRRPRRARARRGARSPSCPTRCSPRCSTCSPAATRPRSSPSCGRASCGTGSRASCAAAPARSGSRSPTPAPSPTVGCSRVFLPDGTRVGELDEEMVYESRPGETFLLGASTWRIEDITYEKVIVTPAPGQPGKMPFWHGDGPGRPLELGRALGAFARELRTGGRRDPIARLRDRRPRRARRRSTSSRTSTSRPRPPAWCPTTARSWSSGSATRSATGGCACCRPFGAQVHAPWAMALQHRLAERWGVGGRAHVERRRHRAPPARGGRRAARRRAR